VYVKRVREREQKREYEEEGRRRRIYSKQKGDE